MWCGHRDGAVSATTVLEWSTQDGVHAFGLYQDDQVVAYGEAWVDDEEHEVELARLIVDPARRGRGIGRTLVADLTAWAATRYSDIFMRVHPENVAALRCYAAAGFEPVAPELAAEWNKPQPIAYAWLRFANPTEAHPNG